MPYVPGLRSVVVRLVGVVIGLNLGLGDIRVGETLCFFVVGLLKEQSLLGALFELVQGHILLL